MEVLCKTLLQEQVTLDFSRKNPQDKLDNLSQNHKRKHSKHSKVKVCHLDLICRQCNSHELVATLHLFYLRALEVLKPQMKLTLTKKDNRQKGQTTQGEITLELIINE